MTRKPTAGGSQAMGEAPLELSRIVEIADLRDPRTTLEFRATDEEAAALAARFGVEGIRNLKASVVLTPFASGNKVALKARFEAEIVQNCVVTLAPLVNRVEGEFLAEFVQDAFTDNHDDIEFAIDDDDPPEPIVDGRIEIGELIAQNLGLAIDPFPRAPGVVFEGMILGNEAPQATMKDGRPNPFAVLERLKTQKN